MLAVFSLLPPTLAQAPISPHIPTERVSTISIIDVPQAKAAELSVNDLKSMATDVAIEHGLNVIHFIKTITCESGWDIYAKGDLATTTGYTSFGLVQLHNPNSDWGIATSTAYKPATALEIMASAWDRGEQWRWSCWRKYYE